MEENDEGADDPLDPPGAARAARAYPSAGPSPGRPTTRTEMFSR